jgi:prepilin signal peptidase PulO-like enzyme (type II secretory pathway)
MECRFNYKRLLAFLLVLSAYVLATLAGVFVYRYFIALSYHPLWAIFLADVAMTLFIYLIGLIVSNASMYDPYWSVIPLLYGLLYMFAYGDYSFRSSSLMVSSPYGRSA